MPLKYKYVHVMRVPVLRHHTMIFGEVIHKVLREYFRAKQEKRQFTEQDIVKLYEGFWSSAGFLSREHEEERFRSGKEMLVNYFREQEAAGIVPLLVEEPFKFLISDQVRVTGRLDRLDDRNGETP